MKFLMIVVTLVAIALLPGNAHGQKLKDEPKPLTPKQIAELEKKALRPPTGASFYIGTETGGAPGRFTLLLTDENRRFVTQSYSLNQLGLVEAVIDEANKFAFSPDASGTTRPVTTRFFDKQEPSFIVDVSKVGLRSQFFVTMIALDGTRLTIDAGVIKRDNLEAKAAFHKMIDKIQAAKANLQ